MNSSFRFNINSLVVVILLLCSLGIGIFNVLGITKLISLFFIFSLVVLLMASIYLFKNTGIDYLVLSLVSISIFNVLLNVVIYGNSNITFDYFKKVLLFVSTVLVLYYFTTKANLIDHKKLLILIPLILNSFIVFAFFILNIHQTYNLTNLESLGFENPNFAAMWLVHLFIISVFCLMSNYSKFIKVLSLLFALGDFFIIVKTGSRAALSTLFIFVLLFVLLSRVKSYEKKRFVLLLFIILPMVFIAFYFIALSIPSVEQLFDSFETDGKTIDSRAAIWSFAFDNLKGFNLLFGNYYGISYGSGISQMHNTHLDVLASYGIIPLILFCVFLYKSLSPSLNIKMNRSNLVALSGVLAIIFLGTFEAGLVSGCTGLNYFTALLFLYLEPPKEVFLESSL